jgi:hypothetical protein
MPGLPLASDTLKSGSPHSELIPLREALGMGWISFGTESMGNTVTVDMDHAEWLDRLDRLPAYHCPLPNMIVIDPWTGKAHATWILKDPVRTGEDDLKKPRNLLQLVRRGLTAMLKGDPAYSGRLTKNPWATGSPLRKGGSPALPSIWLAHMASKTKLRYHTITPNKEPVALSAVRDAVLAFAEDEDIDPQTWFSWGYREASEEVESERGKRLFDCARKRVYKLYQSGGSAAAKDVNVVLGIVQEGAARIGSPASPRHMSQIARSIVQFMRKKYGRAAKAKPEAVNRAPKVGPMGLDPQLPLATKQRMAARHSAMVRANRTRERVLEAATDLTMEGIEPVRALIGKRTGLGRKAVASYWQPTGRAAERECARRCERYPLIELGAPALPTTAPEPPPASLPISALPPTSPPPSQPTDVLPSPGANFPPLPVPAELPRAAPHPRKTVGPPMTAGEKLLAASWIEQLTDGPIPQSGTIPYPLATAMWGHELIEPHLVVRRDDRGTVTDRIPHWRRVS